MGYALSIDGRVHSPASGPGTIADTAVATNHSLVFARRGEPWTAERVSANRWELTRTAEGWKVSKRENRLLTGSEWARQLFSN